MPQTERPTNKRIFLSYNHNNKDAAKRLAHALHDAGEDVWWDEWEILAGDSLVSKIFEQGLSNASAFVILVSADSIRSSWVREELDLATVKRIEGLTRIIPAMIDDVKVPTSLRALRRVDLSPEHFDSGVQEIINAVHGISDKPSTATRESISRTITPTVAGLSKAASTVAQFILTSSDQDSGQEIAVTGSTLHDKLRLDYQVVNDAIDELEDNGFVRVMKALGTAPYTFVQVEPTYVLYEELAEILDYDPTEDLRIVAATVASDGQIGNSELAIKTDLSPGRLNRAVEHLEDFGLVETYKTLGSFPYRFSNLSANRRTRQFAASL